MRGWRRRGWSWSGEYTERERDRAGAGLDEEKRSFGPWRARGETMENDDDDCGGIDRGVRVGEEAWRGENE